MLNRACKVFSIGGLIFISSATSAEGIVDIKPYVSANINYDDNVFRLSSPEQAKAILGSTETSDTVKQTNLGVVVNLRLSRQLLTASTSINESKYNRFKNLDNTGKSNSLRWSWRLGNDVYGEISASKSEAIAGFNETNSPVKNLRTSSGQIATINWNFHPDWTLNLIQERTQLENALVSSNMLDREDVTNQFGIRYQSQIGNELGLAYRISDSSYPNRTGLTLAIFGNETTQKDIIVTAAWSPFKKTRISTQISQASLIHKNSIQPDFNGLSQRWNLDYSLTGKTSVNLTAYQELSAVDDLLSTNVRLRGFSINPIWNATGKITLHAGLGYEERNYLGSVGIPISNSDRYDESKQANISIAYTPTRKSLVELKYQGEDRTTNDINAGYQYNNINFSVRYDY